ncbi:MAG: acyltransferase [Akkermansia sp.]|nr:acyltransferase [Akkermansia sp.]
MPFISNDAGIIRGAYYPHIDGLRAFAVLSVLLFHAYPVFCPGGFIGVDVFFVISGYLITKGLLADLDKGEYSIGKFYVRRIRRILPAYVAMIAFTMLLCVVCYYGSQINLFAKTALSSAFFSTNLFFYKTSGYFSPNSHDNPLLNLWSLSVEEQFYIFFPLLLAALYRWLRQGLKPMVWCLAISSLIGSSVYVLFLHRDTAAFYLLPSRAWELLAGCLLAIHCRDSFRLWRWNGAALIVLVTSFFLFSEALPFPGITAIIPIVCAVLLLGTGQAGLAAPILQHPLTVFIGKISYSLYLFHWPLLVCGHYALDDVMPSAWVSGLALVGSFVCSTLSWRYIETPLRKTRWNPHRYFAFAAAAIFGVSFLSIGMHGLYWFERQHQRVVVESYWDGIAPDKSHYKDPQWEKSENRTDNSLVVLGKDANPQYVLWGDSHAMAAAPGWHDFSEQTGINGIYINRKHTLLKNTYSGRYGNNAIWIESVLAWLREHPELKNIILMNRWAVRAQGMTNEDGKPVLYMRADGFSGRPDEIFDRGLTELCETLHLMGKNTIIISSVPEQGADIPAKMLKFGLFMDNNTRSVPYEQYQLRQREAKAVLGRLETKGLAKIVWVDEVFYPNGEPILLLGDGKVCFYMDDDHLSPSGSKYLLKQLQHIIIPLLQ